MNDGHGAEPRGPGSGTAPSRSPREIGSRQYSAAGAPRPSRPRGMHRVQRFGGWRRSAPGRPLAWRLDRESGLRTVAWADVRGDGAGSSPRIASRGGSERASTSAPPDVRASCDVWSHGGACSARVTDVDAADVLRQPMWSHGPSSSVLRPKADSRLSLGAETIAAIPARRRGAGLLRATPRRPSARPRRGSGWSGGRCVRSR